MFIKTIDGYCDITKYDEIRVERNEKNSFDVTVIKFVDGLFTNTILKGLTKEEAQNFKTLVEINLIIEGKYFEREKD